MYNNSPPPPGEYISDAELRVEAWKLSHQEAKNPITLTKLQEILNQTIKHDDKNKVITFLIMLLNYTDSDQQNIAFNAPSSSGKSYIALEEAKYFPKEDIIKQSYTSPTAFFHELGKLVRIDGTPLIEKDDYVEEKLEPWYDSNHKPSERGLKTDWKEKRDAEKRKFKKEWDNIEKVYEVDLEKKILIFIDQPHDKLLQHLRSLLSHDDKRINVKITDKTKEGGNRTKSIVLVGFPTVIFCSTAFLLDEQERTRVWILSPEVLSDKFKDTIQLDSVRLGDKEAFSENVENNIDRMTLKARVELVKALAIRNILIEQNDRTYIYNKFIENHPKLSARHQRDFKALVALGKAMALLNVMQRRKVGSNIYAVKEDLDEALKLLTSISEANELGIPPYVYTFYMEALQQNLTELGLSRSEFGTVWFTYFHSRLGEKARKNVIELLCEAGLIYEEQDPNNKRQLRIYSPGGGGEIKLINEEEKPEDTAQTRLILESARQILVEELGSCGRILFSRKMKDPYGYNEDEWSPILIKNPKFRVDLDSVNLARNQEGDHHE